MSRSHQFSDYEAPLSKSNSDLESVLTSCGEETDSHLHLPQTPLKSSNSNISDGIIREQVAIGPGRSEKFPHSRSQSIRVNDSTSYLPDLGRQISRMDSNDNDIRSRLRDEDVELNSNIVYNPRRRPQTAQPISHTSMRRQSPSGSNMGSGAPPRSAIFNRLRPATASAIRYTENSVLRTRLDQVKVSLSPFFAPSAALLQLPIKRQVDYQGTLTSFFSLSHRLCAKLRYAVPPLTLLPAQKVFHL
jgi:hypothetical protein